MYIPKHFSETELANLHAFMRQHPFALLVTQHDGALVGNHFPLILDPSEGPYGTLIGHMARGNAQWRTFDGSQEALIVFQGPQAYVSASWYEQPATNVPTWNYTAVHASGYPTLIDNDQDLLALLADQVQTFEAHVANPWLLDPQNERMQALARGTMGFKIVLQKLEGKFKLSQNRSVVDQERVIATLSQSSDSEGQQVAALMQERQRPE